MVNYGSHVGPKPGEKKRNRLKNTAGLGRSLVNQAQKTRKANAIGGSERYTMDDQDNEPNWVKLQSVTQNGDLEEFLSTAELANRDFTSERNQNVKIISQPGVGGANPFLLTEQEKEAQRVQQAENAGKLTVPRRPHWTSDMTAHELDRLEKDAFLDWRRGLAKLQENNDLLLTPFERNIEVWRQLWRVVDRSDLVVQIVDARNPLLFRSEDLEAYVHEVNPKKKNLLLINKADLMTLEQRTAWAEYLNEVKIRYAFFSASTALREVELQKERENESDDEEEHNEEQEQVDNYAVMKDDPTRILTIDQLEQLFLSEAPEPMFTVAKDGKPGVLQIGLVGYPNVGKSSTINALVGAKKVSVSSTPGKTKHFQTINLTSRVALCDCPGLVFPNFAQTNADLVCNGVLPIDNLREYTAPCQLVADRIPQFFLEAVYGITIRIRPIEDGGTGKPTANELLYAFAKARGFMRSGQGTPDESKASRLVLKDYVNAKLLYCVPPPIYKKSEQEFNSQLYNIDALPETRRTQIITAIKESRGVEQLDLDTIDLAEEFKTLKFSLHDPTKKHKEGMANTERFSDGVELDQEFFGNDTGYDARLPFHLQKQKGNGKKHFKAGGKKLR